MMQFAPALRLTIPHARPHGGTGVSVVSPALCVGAILRPTWGVIRVWRLGCSVAAQEFTIAEARLVCERVDRALAIRSPSATEIGVWIDDDDGGGRMRPLVAPRAWFVSFLAAVRRELRKHDAQSASLIRQSMQGGRR
ncbi:MAG: hypothetical protein J0H88_08505 [Sphingomonadales bacterium]|nr:hypothetical protein [Sphingomonadales bacterium]